MNFESWQDEITNDLRVKMSDISPNHKFSEVLNYSIFPTGKLFRPLLSYCIAKDHGEITDNHKLLAQSLEIHHTYTLIHDDLPAMDDDDFRRGRESSHTKFSEWEAILAGDSLLNSSFEILSDIQHCELGKLLKLYSSYTGQKGLILGQVMDLGNENQTLENILHLHELKTARLIQLALKGSAMLSNSNIDLEVFDRIGKCLGVNFQLLDDLCELTDPLNEHEKEINPFLRYETRLLLDIIKDNYKTMLQMINDNNLENLRMYIEHYHSIINKKLSKGLKDVNKHINLQSSELKEIC